MRGKDEIIRLADCQGSKMPGGMLGNGSGARLAEGEGSFLLKRKRNEV